MDSQPHDPADRSSYRHWIKDHVRFADLDPLGHCNHAVISGFFESSRVARSRRQGIGWASMAGPCRLCAS